MWLEAPSANPQTPFPGSPSAVRAAGTSGLMERLAPVKYQEIRTKDPAESFSMLSATATSDVGEKLFEALAKAKVLTSRVAMALDNAWRTGFFDKLDRLHEMDDWEDDTVPVQAASVDTFLRCYIAWRPRRNPALGLSVRGNLIGAWREGPEVRMSIEFLPDDQLTYVLSAPVDGVIERQSGNSQTKSFGRRIGSYPQAEWFDFA